MKRALLAVCLLLMIAACTERPAPQPPVQNPLFARERLVELGFVRDKEFPELYLMKGVTVEEVEGAFEVSIDQFRPLRNQPAESDMRDVVISGVNIRLESLAPPKDIEKSLSRKNTPCAVFVHLPRASSSQ